MSIQAVLWALTKAPVKDPSCHIVLVALAEASNVAGRNAFPSRKTIAKYARCSIRTVASKLKWLEDNKVIMRGNQQLVASFRPDRRPVVYDLNMKLEIDLDEQVTGLEESDDRQDPHAGNDVQELPADNDVQDLHPAENNDVQDLHPVDETPSQNGVQDLHTANGVKSEVERGEIWGSNGVQRVAHKPSFKPPLTRSSSSVLNSPAESDASRPTETPPPSRDLPLHVIEFRQRGYWPSPDTEADARAIARYMDVDESVGNYRRWCAKRNIKPNDDGWSGWFARDEREARERITAQKEAQADLQLAAKLGGTATKKKFNPNAVAE